ASVAFVLLSSAIPALFPDAAQLHPLRAAHPAKTAHWPRNAMRHGAERAHKTRSLRIGSLLNNHRPAGLQIRYITCGCGITTFSFRAGFAAGRTRLEARAARREVLRVVRVTLIVPLSITRRAGIIYSGLRLAQLLTANKIVMASAAGQSACRKVYACASSRPKSESPMAFAGGCPSRDPHRRRVDDRPGSWPRRGWSA